MSADVALPAALLLGALWLALRATRGGGARRQGGTPAHPSYVRAETMTANEAEFHARMRRALGGRYELWPQVSMLALVQPRPGQGWAAFNKVGSRRVDWVVAREGRGFAVVELDDRTHDARRAEDAERDALLGACGWPVIRYDSRRKPDEGTIRADVARAASAA